MSLRSEPWVIVLAGGEGTRLRTLTVDEAGHAIPKQFCSLRGERSLLGDTLARARGLTHMDRVVVVVAAQHARYWRQELAGHSSEGVLVQPHNRGTALGILLPLVSVLARDPEARVLLLPSDHYVEHEGILRAAMLHALQQADDVPDDLILLGIDPERVESGYGWIVPQVAASCLRRVERFVEKPEPLAAAKLFADGALWNSFVVAAHGRALLECCRAELPAITGELEALWALPENVRKYALESWYSVLDAVDFSRAVLEQSVSRLRVAEVPRCGWTDLGTPDRVARVVRGLPRAPASPGPVAAAPRSERTHVLAHSLMS